jgi:SAM-dependent methyltransferase
VRGAPEYYPDEPPLGILYQPDVYRVARRLAERSGATRVIDVGCGAGDKLAALHPQFQIIGVDIGENLERCRARHPEGRWVAHDLESGDPLPLTAAEIAGSVVVCADVIEHLLHPDRTLAALRAAIESAKAVVLSTPDRERLSGGSPTGPPQNPSHVREWTRDELAAFLKDMGFTDGRVTFTRPHSGTLARSTILAILVPPRDKGPLARATPIG